MVEVLFFKLCVFAALVLFLLKLSGKWSGRLPHWVPDLLSRDKGPGPRLVGSGSDSGSATPASRGGEDQGDEDDAVLEWDDETPTTPMTSPAVVVDRGSVPGHVKVPGRTPAKPGLAHRATTRLARMSGEPPVVPVTPEPEVVVGNRTERAEALRQHLLAERERPGMPATRIVKSAAGEPEAPWGNVSERTVWRAWHALPPRT